MSLHQSYTWTCDICGVTFQTYDNTPVACVNESSHGLYTVPTGLPPAE